MRVALLCSGLGRVLRGHEAFARQLFDQVGDRVDMTLFKGGGENAPRECVVPHLPRGAPSLDGMRVSCADKWRRAIEAQERIRIEGVTFAYGALGALLDGAFDVLHCLEREVCDVVYEERHLFAHPPRILFSNGGAIPSWDLPRCDFVQEYTKHNLSFSDRAKAFVIPHGVDVQGFRPGVPSALRRELGIPEDAFLVLSVGAVAASHKRMDYVVREIAALGEAHLLIVGEMGPEAAAIEAEAKALMGTKAKIISLPHERMPEAYCAADLFVLGSVFETFGIAYIEAMASGLPVVCTDHPNQRSIVKEGIFVDMNKPGAVVGAVRAHSREDLLRLGARSRTLACEHYDCRALKNAYVDAYRRIASAPLAPPTYSLRRRIAANLRGVVRRAREIVHGKAE